MLSIFILVLQDSISEKFRTFWSKHNPADLIRLIRHTTTVTGLTGTVNTTERTQKTKVLNMDAWLDRGTDTKVIQCTTTAWEGTSQMGPTNPAPMILLTNYSIYTNEMLFIQSSETTEMDPKTSTIVDSGDYFRHFSSGSNTCRRNAHFCREKTVLSRIVTATSTTSWAVYVLPRLDVVDNEPGAIAGVRRSKTNCRVSDAIIAAAMHPTNAGTHLHRSPISCKRKSQLRQPTSGPGKLGVLMLVYQHVSLNFF